MARKDQREKGQGAVAEHGAHSIRPTAVTRNVSRSPTFVSIYANDIQIHTSPWDLRIVLGEIADTVEGDPPSINVNQLGEVRVSPQLAKRLVQVISEQVQQYERLFGPIPDVAAPQV